jgi:hypothetical protein
MDGLSRGFMQRHPIDTHSSSVALQLAGHNSAAARAMSLLGAISHFLDEVDVQDPEVAEEETASVPQSPDVPVVHASSKLVVSPPSRADAEATASLLKSQLREVYRELMDQKEECKALQLKLANSDASAVVRAEDEAKDLRAECQALREELESVRAASSSQVAAARQETARAEYALTSALSEVRTQRLSAERRETELIAEIASLTTRLSKPVPVGDSARQAPVPELVSDTASLQAQLDAARASELQATKRGESLAREAESLHDMIAELRASAAAQRAEAVRVAAEFDERLRVARTEAAADARREMAARTEMLAKEARKRESDAASLTAELTTVRARLRDAESRAAANEAALPALQFDTPSEGVALRPRRHSASPEPISETAILAPVSRKFPELRRAIDAADQGLNRSAERLLHKGWVRLSILAYLILLHFLVVSLLFSGTNTLHRPSSSIRFPGVGPPMGSIQQSLAWHHDKTELGA